MSGDPLGEPQERIEDAPEEGLSPNADAGGTVTPDAFLANVARIPPRPDAPLPDAMPRPGETLGRFAVLSELGRGGMGVVYAALDSTLGREVALKVLPTSGDDERRRRFLREARAAAALTHPGIATIYDVGEAGGRVFIAMELVRGGTLRAKIADRPVGGRALPLAEALGVARDIARALSRAHERGLVHRDLKPENVMITAEGQVKLLDFGLAKQSDSPSFALELAATEPGARPDARSVATTEEGRILGTPSYMSPEQAKGRAVDARSDVFSFGVMLYELCTGARPFVAGTTLELFIALDRDEPAPPSRVNPRVPPAIERVILRCLRKDPAARYTDAGALLRDLEACADRPPRAWWRRGWLLAPVVAAALVVAATRVHGVRALWGPRPVTVDALPSPASTCPEAVVAYREGLSAIRNGGDAYTSLERAVELDPTLGAAHVQIAAMGMTGKHVQAREHLRRAEELRDSLSERDRGLLDAVEPVVQRQPSDWAESKRRLAALLERSPGDAELWYLLAAADGNFDDFDAAARHLDRALAIDPNYAHAACYRATMLAYVGRFAEARASIDRCLALRPTAEACLETLTYLEDEAGTCDQMEATARQLIAASAHPRAGYWLLANALAARGRPFATVEEALRQSDEGVDELPIAVGREYRKTRIASAARIAVLQGDFTSAERRAREYAPLVTSSMLQSAHGALATVLAGIFEETGQPVEASAVAMEFLDRRDAWEPDPSAEDMALANDAAPRLLVVARRGGRLTPADLAAQRGAWLSAWTTRITPVSRNFLWMYAYARMADTPEDARAALAALPGYPPLPPYRPVTLVDMDVGRTYLLAGRPAEAIPWLEHATRTCFVLRDPFDYVHAHLLLGEAHEARGEKDSACTAYQAVIARWGRATPRSVTAEKASERLQALGCR